MTQGHDESGITCLQDLLLKTLIYKQNKKLELELELELENCN
jgi:hypothetical protein